MPIRHSRFTFDLDKILLEGEDPRIARNALMLLGRKSKWRERKLKQIMGNQQKEPSPEELNQLKQMAMETIEALLKFDPTGQIGTYLAFMAKQVAMDNIVFEPPNYEDGPRLGQTLSFFDSHHMRPQWPELVPGTKPEDKMNGRDVLKWPNWRVLEDYVEKVRPTVNFTSERSKLEGIKSGAKWIFAVRVKMDNGEETTFKVLQCNTPESAAHYGRGTHWCTSADEWKEATLPTDMSLADLGAKLFKDGQLDKGYSHWKFEGWKGTPFDTDLDTFIEMIKDVNKGIKDQLRTGQKVIIPNSYYCYAITTAAGYIRDSKGPLYIIFKYGGNQTGVGKGGQYCQMTFNGSQLKNINDINLLNLRGAFDAMFALWAMFPEVCPKPTMDAINTSIRPRCDRYYPGRPKIGATDPLQADPKAPPLNGPPPWTGKIL